jgi:hypothetical protein
MVGSRMHKEDLTGGSFTFDLKSCLTLKPISHRLLFELLSYLVETFQVASLSQQLIGFAPV